MIRGVILWALLIAAVALPVAGQDEDAPDPGAEWAEPVGVPVSVRPSSNAPELDINTVRVQVSPDLEFVLPYGVIVQRATLPIGKMTVGTRAEFNLPESGVGGEVSLSRRIGRWEPRVVAYQDLNSEAIVSPRLADGELTVTPGEQFTRRVRGVDERIRYYISDRLYVSAGSSFVETITTRFVDNVSTTDAQERTYLITPVAAATLTSLRVRRPKESVLLIGSYVRFEMEERFLENLDHPVDATARAITLWHHQPERRLNLEHQFSVTTPLHVWDEYFFSPPLVGGFDTVRGFSSRHLAATRGAMVRNTATWNPDRTIDITFQSPVIGSESTVPIRIHDVRALLAADTAIVQSGVRWDSDVDLVLGSGPGVAVTVSAGKAVHFDIRSFVVWPVGVSGAPVFYLQGSLFSFASQ